MSKARCLIKQTTGLTGLNVSRDPHTELTELYKRIRTALSKMPPDAAYRKYTEEIVAKRLQAVNSTKTVDELEKAVNCGQAEELIQQARYELEVARKFLTWKPWEPLIQEAPPNQWQWPPTNKS